MTTLSERIEQEGQKKLLAIDGGGIRGVMSLEVLLRIEQMLRAKTGKPNLVLADYFDYIGGTSTGGIIAAGLSIRMTVDELLTFYQECGEEMFVKANLLRRLQYKFEDEPLAQKLQGVFGPDTTLGSSKLRTLLLLVMRNATTDSPWPISNNPYAKYNEIGRDYCNLDMPLWQLVRASTAAPTYFPPERIKLQTKDRDPKRDKRYIFVDGGVTMYNNPTFQMFLMATVDRYWATKPEARWRPGINKMLIVSVGTGTSPDANDGLDPNQMNLLFNASTIPSALMFAALNEQDFLCRVFGDCRWGDKLDREVDDVIGSVGPLARDQKLFSYVRYNAELTRDGLDALGCNDVKPKDVQQLDSVAGVPQLTQVGKAVVEKTFKEAHFAGFLP